MANPFARPAYLNSRSGGTMAVDKPSSGVVLSQTVGTVKTTAKTGYSDITAGRVTLAALELIILLMIAFYIWTHGIQGGG